MASRVPDPIETAGRGYAAVAVAAVALLGTACFFAPATAYLFNATEVTIPLTVVLGAAGPWPWVAAAIIGLSAVVGRASARRPLALSLVVLAALLYLQGNVLVGRYGNFDGQAIDWSRHMVLGFLDWAVWLGVPALAYVLRRRLLPRVGTIALVLVLANAATFAAHLAEGRSLRPAQVVEIDDRLYEFSSTRNVLIIVMDAFASPAFAHVLDADPAWQDRLDGFTWYRDALAVYPTTLPSIPTILSGRTTDNTAPMKTYLTASLAASLPVALQNHGVMAHTLTEPIYGEYLAGTPVGSHLAFLDSQPDDRRLRDAVRIWNVALFRYLPQPLKRQVYDGQNWLLAAPRASGGADEPALPYVLEKPYRIPSPGQQATWLMWRRMVDHARSGSPQPTFKFLHFFTTHTPYFVAADCTQLTDEKYAARPVVDRVVAQSSCALEQVTALLDRLAGLGVLDETLVILTGDHGSHIDLVTAAGGGRDWGGLPAPTKVRPLLLVKPIGARGTLEVSGAPVSLADIPATVAQAMGIADEFPGPGLDNIPPDVPRTRTYRDYTWEHLYWWEEYLPPLTTWEVTGAADDPRSWRRVAGPEDDAGPDSR